METGKSKDSEIVVIHENLAHGVQTTNTYDDKEKDRENVVGWWYLCCGWLGM